MVAVDNYFQLFFNFREFVVDLLYIVMYNMYRDEEEIQTSLEQEVKRKAKEMQQIA